MSFKLLENNITKRMVSLQNKTKKGGGLCHITAQTYSESLTWDTWVLIRKGRGSKDGGKERETRDTQKVKSNPPRGLPRHSKYILSWNPARQGRRLCHALIFRTGIEKRLGGLMIPTGTLYTAGCAPALTQAQPLKLLYSFGPSTYFTACLALLTLYLHHSLSESVLVIITTMVTFLNYCLVTIKDF